MVESFKEFSRTLTSKLCSQSVTYICSPDNTFSSSQPYTTVREKDPQKISIPISEIFIEFNNFALQDDFIPMQTQKNKKKQLQTERSIMTRHFARSTTK